MIRLLLLGQIGLTAPDGRQLGRVMAGEKRLGLLVYLALAMPGARRRDTLLGMFWPEASAGEARHRLRQLLYVLRAELGEGVLDAESREEISLNPELFWCDATAFEKAYKQEDLETCFRLYGGLCCEGLFMSESPAFDRWLEDTRERLHESAVDAAWRLAQRNENNGALMDACYWGRQALRLDPDEERLRWLLGLYERRGDRIRAIRLFERFQRILATEFDMAPAEATLGIIDRIRSSSASRVSTTADTATKL